MINKIEISNFRSIEHAEIDLNRPVTVIVGPNGVGKTNLLLALRFVKDCIKYNPVRAIQLANGLDQVFRMKVRRTRELKIKIYITIPDRFETHSGNSFFLEQEDLRAAIGKKVAYEFSLSYSGLEKKLNVVSECVYAIDSRGIENKILDAAEMYKTNENSPATNPKTVDSNLLLSFTNGYFYFSSRSSMSIEHKALLYSLQVELANLQDYNLNPFSLRGSSDLLSIKDLEYDGSGTSSFLYRLEKNQLTHGTFFEALNARKDGVEIWNELRQRFGGVIDFVDKISFIEDISSTNVSLRIRETANTAAYNSKQISDGTLKYIILVAKILTASYSLIGLEEVENCLHPKAIRELLSLIYEVSAKYNVQFVITSHSETVLNNVTPQSILIARRLPDGSSVYAEPSNFETLQEELNSSGFGLGTYWGTHEGID